MILDGIARLLDAEIASLTFNETAAGGNVFVDTLPQAPDVSVGIYHAGGYAASSLHPEDLPTPQIVVRGTRDPRTAVDLWYAIYSVLHARRNVTLPDGTYLVYCLVVQSGPVRIGPDENGRQQYSMNLECMVANPTSQRA